MTTALPSVNKFWKMLRDHDWTFDYSDDHSVWRRGRAELDTIMEVVKNGGDEYKKLFDEYSAYAWRKDDSIQQPLRPCATKEEQIESREMLQNISESLDLICNEIWSIEADDVVDAVQLRKLLNPIQGMISQISNIVEDKSKSPMWNTVAFKGYKRIKDEVDRYAK